ncbi:calcium-binding protein, partial [Rubrivivax gelatinosus]|uniref:calcium-binding protein n=1 Tax=Rubrivivax gelatinosus TaxID=28068 RepID=UPI0023DEB3E7
NDTYVVDHAGDAVIEDAGGGTDTIRTTLATYSLAALPAIETLVYTGAGSFAGTGNDGANSLAGGAGYDTLDGGIGADTLSGGLGNDTYLVDSILDVVVEGAAGGTDTVVTTLLTYFLGTQIENAAFAGTGNFAATGNTNANLLTGGSGNDTLNGAGGIDTMVGGLGDDTYVVDHASDVVTEAVNGGSDTIR